MNKPIRSHKYTFIAATLLIIILSGFVVFNVSATTLMQQTVMPPTVTGTSSGVIAVVRLDQEAQINVRSGPGVFFDKIGVLLPGQSVPVIGRTSGGDWILVVYPGVADSKGWVYAPYVSLSPGDLPIIEPPPTSTPGIVSTIDATLAAQFIITEIPTQLPTFTAPPPIEVPTFVDASSSDAPGGIPMGLVIISLVGLGLLIGLVSLFQNR